MKKDKLGFVPDKNLKIKQRMVTEQDMERNLYNVADKPLDIPLAVLRKFKKKYRKINFNLETKKKGNQGKRTDKKNSDVISINKPEYNTFTITISHRSDNGRKSITTGCITIKDYTLETKLVEIRKKILDFLNQEL